MFSKTFILLGLIVNTICSPVSNSQSSSSTASSRKDCCNGANLNPTQVKSSSYDRQQKAVNSFLDSIDNSEIFTPEWILSDPELLPNHQQFGRMLECTDSSCANKACENEKPFKCNICGTTFTRSYTLKEHLKTVHYNSGPDRNFKCPICGASFKGSSPLTQHLKRAHKKNK